MQRIKAAYNLITPHKTSPTKKLTSKALVRFHKCYQYIHII